MTVTTTARDDGVAIRITGAMNEGTDFAQALAGANGHVVVDLSGVERVNSYGVREWIHFLRGLEAKAKRVTLAGVSVVMVRQMNMIPEVRGTAEVTNVFAPYYCPRCEDERTVALPEHAKSAPAHAPCPECQAQMDFDDVAEGYFLFQTDEERA
jgi:anti-anti-sigma regulatory factor